MAWSEITRRHYARRTARYASDMTDREWSLVEPFLPMPRRLGRPRSTDLREVVNALLYIAMTGCQWRMLPKDFRPVRPSSAISMNGGRWDFGAASIIIWSWRPGNWKDERQVRRLV